jgi:hypothetical protein
MTHHNIWVVRTRNDGPALSAGLPFLSFFPLLTIPRPIIVRSESYTCDIKVE